MRGAGAGGIPPQLLGGVPWLREKLSAIPGLPKKGVNQFFACAVQYPKLHADIERYARLAMREYEWYNNLSDESCAMPGTFAVFALGLEGEQWAPLVTEYLDLCDDEHSSLQDKFLHAFIRKFGFQPWTLGVLVRGALSMQWMKPAKEFRSLIANAESLDALLAVKRRFSAYLLSEENKDRNSGPSLGRAYSGPSGVRPPKTVAARSSKRPQKN